MDSRTTAVIITIIFAMTVSSGLHAVNEGYLGLYWRGGALLDQVAEPGFHVKSPFLTSFAEVQVSVQTDRVRNIPCGTKGGVIITFDNIEVVNRLRPDKALDTVRRYGLDYDKIWIFDKIHHEINQFCSAHTLQEVYIDLFDTMDESLARSLQADCNKWDTGIEIIAARVTKPHLPAGIYANYEKMEEEKTQLMISMQHQHVVAIKQETAEIKAVIEAQKEKEVSAIKKKIQLLEAQAEQSIQQIEDDMILLAKHSDADAQFYAQERRSEANQLKFTPEYMQYQTFSRIKGLDKSYYGKDFQAAIASAGDDLWSKLSPGNTRSSKQSATHRPKNKLVK